MTSLKLIVLVPGFVFNIEEYNEDFIKEVIVWLDLRGMHCSCSPGAFKGYKLCNHKKVVVKWMNQNY